MLTGDNGILTKASSAKQKTLEAQELEQIQLAHLTSKTNTRGEVEKDVLLEELEKITPKLSGLPESKEAAKTENWPWEITGATGKIYSITEDEVTVTGTSEGGSSQTPTEPVEPEEVEITGIEGADITLEIGETKVLQITKTPENPTEDVIYTSNNTDIVTVDASGNVTGLAVGETTITIKSESEKVTTTCTVTVTEPEPTVEAVTSHTAAPLDSTIYTWEKIAEIAKVISDNDETITNETAEAKVTIGETEYTLGVGDTTIVNYDGTNNTVRIIGFNHDELASSTAYGELEENTYAGISFEFVDFYIVAKMNNASYNSGGWGTCEIRSTMNNTTSGYITKLSNENYIKEVNKKYIKDYDDSSSVTTSADKLWLLSCSEIWDNARSSNAAYGYAIAKEGSQYKYYKNIDADSNTENTALVKGSREWWLRSPYFFSDSSFCCVDTTGVCNTNHASNWGIPITGFSI